MSASPTTSPHSPAVLLAVLIGVALLAIAARVIPQPRTIDDAFITFRYSRNIVEGEGFVYNPGARTLGTTTPFYTVWMAAISFVSGSESYPWFALITSSLADAATVILLGLLAYRLTRHLLPAALIGILWALSPMSVTFAIGGMETSVVILWLVAAAYCYVTGHERGMAVFAALGVLTRIDTLIWVGPLLLHQLITHWRQTRADGRTLAALPRRVPWQSWAIFAVILLPWYVFSWRYFGSLLSNSLQAKQVAYHIEDFHALVRLLQHIATPFMEAKALGVPGIVIGLALYPALAASGTLYAVKRAPRLLPFLLYPWLYIAVFGLMNPLIFRWYLAPLLAPYFLAILLGVWGLGTSVLAALDRTRALPRVVAALGIVWIALSLNAWTLRPDHGPDRPAPKMAWHQIELYYRQMAEQLRREYGVNEETLLAAGDIGAIGFYSRARILDTVGLVTPELSRYYPLPAERYEDGQNYIVPPPIIFDYDPDYIVFMEMFLRHGLADEPDFTTQYAQVDRIPTDFYGTGMLLYQRRDLARTGARPAILVPR
ncbi:MAG: hypothetical protein GXY36_00195 [Chloroflexi bacterium]|nr:hypothetical protein [Chloroflexota bacterium]